MRNRILFFIILFFSFNALLFSMGRQDEVEVKTQNNRWVLCISNFDSSSLPENKNNIAGVIMKKLVENLSAINFRTRLKTEYAYYEETAWLHARSEKAKAVAAKQNERSMLIFKGDSGWRYRRNLERIDEDIKKLYLELEEIDNNAPVINEQPVFGLVKDNLENKFPDAPITGNEYQFCLEHKSDALLTGSVIMFHERFVVTLRLYTIYTQSFLWEDSVIFSHDDLENAVDEYTRSLIIALSGSEPVILAVKAEPEETLLLINGAFAGRGETSKMEYPPGTITIDASAPEHKNLTFETELFSGDYTEIDINLRPVEYVNVEIPGTFEGKIYHGALYVGEAPLTLRLPLNQMDYIELETHDNAKAAAVFHSFGEAELTHSLALPEPIQSAKGSVDRARRNFYWSWGGTWAAAAAAWISYNAYVNSNTAISSNYVQTGSYNQDFYDRNLRMYYISMGSFIALGAAVVLDIFFISRYVKAANKGNVSVTESGRD